MNKRCENINLLCYVCGLFTPLAKQVTMSGISDNYFQTFQIDMEIQDYTPNKICHNCYTMLTEKRKFRRIPKSPMVWGEPDLTHSNCYACLTPNLNRYNMKTRESAEYPVFPLTNSHPPVWRNEDDEIAEPQPGSSTGPTFDPNNSISLSPTPQLVTMSPSEDSFTAEFDNSISLSHTSQLDTSEELFPSKPPKVAKLMGQSSFNDFVRDLGLKRDKVELAGSRMRENNWLQSSTRTTFLRNETTFSSLFKNVELSPITKTQTRQTRNGNTEYTTTVTNTLTYCDNLEALFEEFEHEFKADEWRLFMDGSTESLKFALLHNDNSLPSIIIAYSRFCPETYETMKEILEYVMYDEYEFEVIVDFKLVNIVQGHMSAAAKYPCIHCLWEARYNKPDKYTKIDWPPRPLWSDEAGPSNNAIKKPLIPRHKMLFPPLHIKIGLVTQFMKNAAKNEEVFKIVKSKIFPGLSEAKISAGVYDGPDIRKLFKSAELLSVLSSEEKTAFECLKQVCANFLGNNRAHNYEEIIKNMATSYQKLGINITIKLHSLICHLDQFKDNCGKFSDEQGERVHQTLKQLENDYKGKNMANGLGLYCFRLIREKDPDDHKRKAVYKNKTGYFLVNKR